MKISCDNCKKLDKHLPHLQKAFFFLAPLAKDKKKLNDAVLSGIAKNCKMYEEKSA